MAYAIVGVVFFWLGYACCALMTVSSRCSREEEERMRRRAGRVFLSKTDEVGDAGPLD